MVELSGGLLHLATEDESWMKAALDYIERVDPATFVFVMQNLEEELESGSVRIAIMYVLSELDYQVRCGLYPRFRESNEWRHLHDHSRGASRTH